MTVHKRTNKTRQREKFRRLSRCRSSLLGAAASCRSEGRDTPVWQWLCTWVYWEDEARDICQSVINW